MAFSEKIMTLSEKGSKKNYLREVQEELKRISWTSKEELFLNTKIVLGATFCFSLAVFGTDFLIRSCLNSVWYLAHILGA